MARPEGKGPDKGQGDLATSMRQAQPFIDASWQFVASVGLMCWLGYWADGKLGTKPWLLVTGSLLGFAAGMYALVKVVLVKGKRPDGQG